MTLDTNQDSKSDPSPSSDPLSASRPTDALSSSSSIPSFVDDINLETIAVLAEAARRRTTRVACTIDPVPTVGAFDVVWFITFADGVEWICRTPIISWTPILEKRLRSDVIGMKLIESRTTVPIPRLHDFSATPENPFGRPYMLMDRVKGTQLYKRWFDPAWFTDERRKTVFESLVSCMSKLKTLTFPYIGSLDYSVESASHVVVPLLPSLDDIVNEKLETDTAETPRGPYSTVHAYLLGEIGRKIALAPTKDHKVTLALLRMFAGFLPDEALDGPPFVLSLPDFNNQNIFVDDDGKVTGIIDWDGLMAGPREGGFARYPSWITQDWDPLMYGYEDPENIRQGINDGDGDAEHPAMQSLSREHQLEDSPSTLQAFREEYLAAFTRADPASARCTRHSHVFEALEIAISSKYCRGHIVERLSKYVFGIEADSGEMLTSWNLKHGIAAGDWLTQLE